MQLFVTMISLHHLFFVNNFSLITFVGSQYFSLGAALVQKNTLSQNNYLKVDIMISEKTLQSYYCLIVSKYTY